MAGGPVFGIVAALGAVSLGSAAIFPALKGYGWFRSGIKTLAIGAVSVWALYLGHFGLALALALSALGDLALSRPGERAFLIGIICFAAAHIAYVVLFLSAGFYDASPAAISDLYPRTAAALILVTIGFWLGRLYAKNAGALAMPVRAYVTIIVLMGLGALTLPANASGLLVMAGAMSFMISDALIGQQKFLNIGWTGQDFAIWWLYYIGQIAIFVGLSV
ncbi:lysoplasmalogenase family protein [Thalassococcus lentus]|uniref:Lysoplasmalogenase family protein n=1 Tax=Thalassococcus lentus TaxID=1210524 RepID=A0ABT4XVI0_9RHOB|nr:lysoplasmalogenase family protein [Thalassococcus lentus]MDA7425855.1 lysoplasmalogenase family protein [Thalassococcus lentus]